MPDTPKIIFWFRRDLRLNDNAGLYHALRQEFPVIPLFIFDEEILQGLPPDDKRVVFIHRCLGKIQDNISSFGSSLLIKQGEVLPVWEELLQEYKITAVFANSDYEPAAIERDKRVRQLLDKQQIPLRLYKDQVIFEKSEIVKHDGNPYTVYSYYRNQWMDRFIMQEPGRFPSENYLHQLDSNRSRRLPALQEIGFKAEKTKFPSSEIPTDIIRNYHNTRDYPALENGTTRLGIHLRFGTISIRELAAAVNGMKAQDFLNELIWRDFFMMILYHFPQVVNRPFKEKYADIRWIDDENHFEKWKQGKTGYPMVDAGMRQLMAEGYMHNRVRMITASFLSKHLLINWQWGEKWFAEKLLDFELSSNNGNWQWSAGCGVDAAPYFRIFNPLAQQKKYDPDLRYIKKYVPEYGSSRYPEPLVEHRKARERALSVYGAAVKQ
ncbi:MAG: deoxyribodipyrimidine photo-lyase [Calditrichia bacterium]